MHGALDSDSLDDRTQNVLIAVIQSFIQTAEPVGSRTVSKRFDFGLSPATIRNVMSDLEDLGFLEQPHTSAGRVPTDKGYRYFVNHLRDRETLSVAESAFISQRYTPYRGEEVDEVMAATSRLLSEISHYAGVVMRTFSTTVFKRIEFVKVRGHQVLAIFVMESGMVQNKLITLDEEMNQDELYKISHYLNQEFAGQTLHAIRQHMLERMSEEKARYDILVQQAMKVGEKTFIDTVEEKDIYLGGTANIMDQPEFVSNVEQLRDIFKAFEERSRIISVLDKCLDEAGVNVVIGSETPFKGIHECSFVTHTYKYDGCTLGLLGVVGPKRMDYPRIMAIVNYTANLVSKILTQG